MTPNDTIPSANGEEKNIGAAAAESQQPQETQESKEQQQEPAAISEVNETESAPESAPQATSEAEEAAPAPAEAAEEPAEATEPEAETAPGEQQPEDAPQSTSEAEEAAPAPAEAAEEPAEAAEPEAEAAPGEQQPEDAPQATGEAEEAAPAPAETAEEPAEAAEPKAEAPAAEEEEKKHFPVPESKQAVTERLREISHSDKSADKEEVDYLKKMYYRLRREEVEAQLDKFLQAGGKEEDFLPGPDTEEEAFKAEMALVREKRAKEHAELEKRKQANLQRKQEILEQIKAFSASPEEANKNYDAFRKLQAEWKETNPVPAENSTELWKNYQYLVENFYDMLKLNNEFREYDFKKNLEAKLHLCEAAEKLADVADPVSAFHQLQKLHQEYRETGPVARDLREQVWNRFKAASVVVNKRHQEFFEKQKEVEKANLEKKTALCEEAEKIDIDNLQSRSDWDKALSTVLRLQEEWKKVGYAPKSANAQIYERFHAVCTKYFRMRAAYLKEVRAAQHANYQKKVALCEQAEALKDSTDWSATAAKEDELMTEWKAIGSVPKKLSDAIWKRFKDARNAFFDARRKAFSSQRDDERQNLNTKLDIIAKLKEITADAKSEGAKMVRSLMDEWQKTGFVPFKMKDKVQKEYKEQIDRLFKELNMSSAARRVEDIRAQASAALSRGGDALYREREKLFRIYEAKRNEIQTYENNLGFLSVSSKTGSSFVEEIKRRIENLKGELAELRKSIEEIDRKSKADAEAPAETSADAKPKDEAPAAADEADGGKQQ